MNTCHLQVLGALVRYQLKRSSTLSQAFLNCLVSCLFFVLLSGASGSFQVWVDEGFVFLASSVFYTMYFLAAWCIRVLAARAQQRCCRAAHGARSYPDASATVSVFRVRELWSRSASDTLAIKARSPWPLWSGSPRSQPAHPFSCSVCSPAVSPWRQYRGSGAEHSVQNYESPARGSILPARRHGFCADPDTGGAQSGDPSASGMVGHFHQGPLRGMASSCVWLVSRHRSGEVQHCTLDMRQSFV